MADKAKKASGIKQLPFSVEAEKSLIGCILVNGSIVGDVVAAIGADAFYVEAHRLIYDAIVNLAKSGVSVDVVTVSDSLMRENSFDKVGGISYLTSLNNAVPSSANIKDYIEIVRRNYKLRKLISVCSEVIGDAYSQEDYQFALADAEKRIYDLSQEDMRGELTPISQSMGEVLKRFDLLKKDKNAFRGIQTGFWKLDEITNGLHGGELIVLAARPGEGKSSLGMNIVERAAKDGKSCAVFSLEMPKIQIAQRLLCSCAGINLTKAQTADITDSQWTDLFSTIRTLEKLKIHIDDSSMNTPAELLSKSRRLKNTVGLDLILVDYIQLMSSGDKKVENRQQDVSTITRNLKIYAKELDVPIIALSQMSRQIESRKDSVPQLSDLRESGAIEQDADIVMFIYKDKTETVLSGNAQKRILSVAKHRNGELCDIPLKWIGEYVRFQNMTGADFDFIKQSQKMAKGDKEQQSEEAAAGSPESVPNDLDLPNRVVYDNLSKDVPPENAEPLPPPEYYGNATETAESLPPPEYYGNPSDTSEPLPQDDFYGNPPEDDSTSNGELHEGLDFRQQGISAELKELSKQMKERRKKAAKKEDEDGELDY
ncbi:MAG: replicative DNA helicase [Clostridia bacterium]|nr:replicative DNA helicase [Clostridia bacterium]